jgi:F420-0:gamma-glutamyl ligase-like protein
MSSQYITNLGALLGKTQETLREFRAFSANEQNDHKHLLLKYSELLNQNYAIKQQLAAFQEANLTRARLFLYKV